MDISEIYEKLEEAEQDIKEGRLLDAEVVFKQLKEKYGQNKVEEYMKEKDIFICDKPHIPNKETIKTIEKAMRGKDFIYVGSLEEFKKHFGLTEEYEYYRELKKAHEQLKKGENIEVDKLLDEDD